MWKYYSSSDDCKSDVRRVVCDDSFMTMDILLPYLTTSSRHPGTVEGPSRV